MTDSATRRTRDAASIEKGFHCGCREAGDDSKTTLGSGAIPGQEQSETAHAEPSFASPGVPVKQQHKNFEVTRKHAATPLGFKFSVGDAGEIEGYGSIFGNVDSAGERVVAGAFSASIEKHKQDGTAPLMLWQHRESEPIGRWTSVEQDSLGLKLIGRFNLETSRGREAYAHVKQGDLTGLSIGYRANKVHAAGDVLDLLEIDLFEVSVVSFPANPKARVTGVKCESAADVERVLREGGLSRVAALRIATGGWRALSPQSNQIVKSFADRVSRATDELFTLKGKL